MRLFEGLLLLLSLLGATFATESSVQPEVWIMPSSHADGRSWRELFSHPDEWQNTRKRIQVLCYADHVLHNQFKDEELRVWLPQIKVWGLKFALEVGALKEWGKTGRGTFEKQRPMWDRFLKLGSTLDAVAMDEPLCCAREKLKQTNEFAVEETAQFVALVRQHYPDVRVGDIEPYPSRSLAELTAWIDALETKLRQMNVRGLDFFAWMSTLSTLPPTTAATGAKSNNLRNTVALASCRSD